MIIKTKFKNFAQNFHYYIYSSYFTRKIVKPVYLLNTCGVIQKLSAFVYTCILKSSHPKPVD